jgi:glycosyltransferase involved in cell wall biosynthesis
MMKRQVYEQVGGFDPRFDPAGYEDNDFCRRAREKGFLGVIAQDTFIYHHASSTIKDLKYDIHAKRWQYYDKWKKEGKKKLVITYFLRGNKLTKDALDKAQEVADDVILEKQNIIAPRKPNEAKQRNELLRQAKEQNPDWILSLENNMMLEDRFTKEYAQRLMNPVQPDILAYEFQIFNVSDKDPDLVIGEPQRMTLMFRNLPNQHIRSRHPQGYNAPIMPPAPDNAKRLCPIRIKRLVPENLIRGEIRRWKEKKDIALVTIMKDEEQYLDSFFEAIEGAFDEVVLADTGSSDNSKELAQKWGAKVYDFEWRDHFAAARDFALDKTNCEFILQLDIDEKLEDIAEIYKMINQDNDAYLFTLVDLMPGGKVSYPESVRLFRNRKGIHYAGVIHETTIETMNKIPDLRVARATTRIIHQGRLRPGRDQRQGYYEYLANRQMRKDPESPLPYYHLALIERDRKNMEKALKLIQEAAFRGFEKPNIRLELANTHLMAAYIVYKTLRELDPQHPYYGLVKERLAILKRFFPDL